MSPPQVAPKRRYISGHCGTGHCGACRGAYAGADCGHRCHDTPEPPEAVSVDPGPFLAYHCVTCMCPERAGLVGVDAMVTEAPAPAAGDTGGASATW